MVDELVILITTGSKEEAQNIAGKLVDAKLAACANILPGIQSIFQWQGEICDEGEVLMILKSTKAKLDALIREVKALHSYDVPEVIALPIIGGSREYLDWVQAETQAE